MMNRELSFRILPWVVFLSMFAAAQAQKKAPANAPGINPAMNRLAKMFVGDWNTSETMERGDEFPNGGGRHGRSHCELVAGGSTLTCQGHSDGAAGDLQYLIAIWWDETGGTYHFFTCFNRSDANPCVVRGTAHWDGDTFVNDYEEMDRGKMTKMRDSFTMPNPTTRTLVAGILNDDGTMKTLVTTRSVRRTHEPKEPKL